VFCFVCFGALRPLIQSPGYRHVSSMTGESRRLSVLFRFFLMRYIGFMYRGTLCTKFTIVIMHVGDSVVLFIDCIYFLVCVHGCYVADFVICIL
jgi:hypothetical protein